MSTRFTAPVWAEPAHWDRKPGAEAIDAVGRALPTGYTPNDEQQRAWFGALVFDAPPVYRSGKWHIGGASFSSQQVAAAVAAGRRLGVR